MAEPRSDPSLSRKEPRKSVSTTKRRKKSRYQRLYCRYKFAIGIYKVLKKVHSDLRISCKALTFLNFFLMDVFQRISEEVTVLLRYSKHSTITYRVIETAVRLLLPRKMGQFAVLAGKNAIDRYHCNQ
ncbi:PREDICTED: histone H2B 1.1-like [Elephantulus edwardii]|uniref:histone H2B 1.1-like n=1 Tax=Elephantulus edwardii TaxID=28737 RepID=UPI0003F0759B|nr:PREDICTED: histone H2B 1.1-like [Elephantulus edwardii]